MREDELFMMLAMDLYVKGLNITEPVDGFGSQAASDYQRSIYHDVASRSIDAARVFFETLHEKLDSGEVKVIR